MNHLLLRPNTGVACSCMYFSHMSGLCVDINPSVPDICFGGFKSMPFSKSELEKKGSSVIKGLLGGV